MKKLIIIFVVALMAASCANFKRDTSAISDYVYTFFYNKKSSKMALANAIVRNPDSTKFYIKNSEFYDERLYERYLKSALRKKNGASFNIDFNYIKENPNLKYIKNKKFYFDDDFVHGFYYQKDANESLIIMFIFDNYDWYFFGISFEEGPIDHNNLFKK